MITKKELVLMIFGVFIATNAFFIGQYLLLSLDLRNAHAQIEGAQLNKRVLNFSGLFIEKVLQADKEVSFEDRLQLETAVRELQDQEILAQWQKFTNSGTGVEAQVEVKNLLALLIKKAVR